MKCAIKCIIAKIVKDNGYGEYTIKTEDGSLLTVFNDEVQIVK